MIDELITGIGFLGGVVVGSNAASYLVSRYTSLLDIPDSKLSDKQIILERMDAIKELNDDNNNILYNLLWKQGNNLAIYSLNKKGKMLSEGKNE